MKTIHFQKEKIDAAGILNRPGTETDGSQLVFAGRVRNSSKGKKVLRLEYEIYEEMALNELHKIADASISQWGLSECLIIQRYGEVETGEISILISVSSPHRHDSYMASRFIIDSIKKTVPVWKKEIYEDGSCWIHDRH